MAGQVFSSGLTLLGGAGPWAMVVIAAALLIGAVGYALPGVAKVIDAMTRRERFRLLASLSEAHARPLAVLLDEQDAGSLQRLGDRSK